MISQGLRKPAALLLVGLVVGLLFTLVIFPYLGLVSKTNDSIISLKTDLIRYQTFQEKAETYGEALDAGNFNAANSLLFQASSAPTATANLQNQFSSLAQGMGISATSFRPITPQSEDGLIRFGFRVTFQASTFNFLELLKGMENFEELVLVKELSVQTRGQQSPGQDPQLTVQMDVVSFMEEPNV